MSYEFIALMMFGGMMLMLLTGQRVFAAIGFVAALAAVLLYGTGGTDIPFAAAMKIMKWYPLLTLPMFVLMGYTLSESGLAEDLYQIFHVAFGGVPGGLAIGTIGLMVLLENNASKCWKPVLHCIKMVINATFQLAFQHRMTLKNTPNWN